MLFNNNKKTVFFCFFFPGHNLPALKDTIIPYRKVSLYLVILKVAEIKLPTSERNSGLGEAQAGIKTARRNINNLRYADNTPLMEESEEERERLLMKVKEESEKVGLKLNIQKTKIMASSPITSWQKHAKMGSIKDRNSMNMTEVEDIKKRWQEYTKNCTKKIFMTQLITKLTYSPSKQGARTKNT